MGYRVTAVEVGRYYHYVDRVWHQIRQISQVVILYKIFTVSNNIDITGRDNFRKYSIRIKVLLKVVEVNHHDEIQWHGYLAWRYTDWIAPYAGHTHCYRQSTSNNFQIMPDMSHSLGTFNGKTCEERMSEWRTRNEWLRNINATAELHHWDSSSKLQLARANW